jgi:hypothetical protein
MYERMLRDTKILKAYPNTGYELRPCLFNMVREQSFSGEDDENPYLHQRVFEQTYACLHIVGMSDEILR